jgi:hypothetical protein
VDQWILQFVCYCSLYVDVGGEEDWVTIGDVKVQISKPEAPELVPRLYGEILLSGNDRGHHQHLSFSFSVGNPPLPQVSLRHLKWMLQKVSTMLELQCHRLVSPLSFTCLFL